MPDAVRVTLPFVDINAFNGLASKQNPETLDPKYLREAKNIDFFRIYGAISKIRGNKRILNTVYSEGGSPKKIGWLGFYKFPDPNGQIQRKTLAACGTTLRSVNSDGTTTQLKTGLNEGLIRTSDNLDRFMFITGQDMYSVGNKDAMMVYDGENVNDWGLRAPGETETVREDFGTSTTFTSTASAGTITITDDTSISWDGDSKKVTCSTAGIYRFSRSTYGAFTISTATSNRVKFYVYIPRNQFAALSSAGADWSPLTYAGMPGTAADRPAMVVTFSSDVSGIPVNTNCYHFYFTRDRLNEGWNELFCDFSTAPSGTVGGSTGTLVPTSIDSIQFEINTTGAVTTYFDRLLTLDAGAPTVTLVDPTSTSVFTWGDNTEKVITTRTEYETFDTLADFALLPAGAPANVLSASTDGLSPDGVNDCIRVDKLDVTTAYFSLSQTPGPDLNINLTGGFGGKFSVWVYVPDASKMRLFAGSAANYAIRFFVTSTAGAVAPNYNGTAPAAWGAVNYSYWDYFYGGTESLVNGWNQLIFDSATPTGSGGAGAAVMNSVDSFFFGVHLNEATTTMSDFRFDALGKNHLSIPYVKNTYMEADSAPPDLANVGPSEISVYGDASNYAGWADVTLAQNTLKISKVTGTTSNASEVICLPGASGGHGTFILQYPNGPAKTLLYFYLPDPTLLVTSFPIEFSLYTTYDVDTPEDDVFNKWVIPYTSLNSGWNTIEIDLTQPDEQANGGIDDLTADAVVAVKMKFIFNSPSTRADGIHLLGLISFENDGALSGGGIYSYRITYETEEGFESNAGPKSTDFQVATGGQNTSLTNIPVSSDTSVTKKNIYRTAGGGGLWLYLDTIPNEQTTYSDEIADGALGSTQPPFAGDDTFDNSIPPSCGIVKVWKRTVFLAGDPLNPQALYFSRPDNPNSFPVLNRYELDSRITGIFEAYLGLVVTTENDTWRVIGDNPDYTVEKVVPGHGAVGPRAVGAIRLDGWAVNRDGLRLYDLRNMVPISEQIRDKFYSLEKRNIELMHTVHFKKMNSYLQFNPDNNGDYSSVFMYQYEADDARTGVGWSELELPANLNILHTTEVEDSDGESHLYAGAEDGMVYELFAEDSYNWVDANGTETPIISSFGTHYMRLGALGVETQIGTGRCRPRFVELRAEELNGQDCVWNVLIETAYGSNNDAFSLGQENMEFNIPGETAFYRLSCDPAQTSPASHIRISVTNSELNVATLFYGLRIYLIILPDQRPIETGNVY